MAGENVTLVRLCAVCRTEVGTFEVKKENMMLTTSAKVMCPTCRAERPEIREVAGRLDEMAREKATYPTPASTSASLTVPGFPSS